MELLNTFLTCQNDLHRSLPPHAHCRALGIEGESRGYFLITHSGEIMVWNGFDKRGWG